MDTNDDGTQAFGELHPEMVSAPWSNEMSRLLRLWMPRPGDNWDTPEWRAEMEAKYPCPDM